jgi:tetratricopeptide (TPR) repeat protein
VKYVAAEPLLQRALAIAEASLGPTHPATGEWLNNLAGLYDAMGAYAQAKPLLKRALAIVEQGLGADHPNTKVVRGNYESLLQTIQKAE